MRTNYQGVEGGLELKGKRTPGIHESWHKFESLPIALCPLDSCEALERIKMQRLYKIHPHVGGK